MGSQDSGHVAAGGDAGKMRPFAIATAITGVTTETRAGARGWCERAQTQSHCCWEASKPSACGAAVAFLVRPPAVPRQAQDSVRALLVVVVVIRT